MILKLIKVETLVNVWEQTLSFRKIISLVNAKRSSLIMDIK